MAFLGLDKDDNVDVAFAARYGLEGLANNADRRTRWKTALESACASWENHTGREYRRTEAEGRLFQVDEYCVDEELEVGNFRLQAAARPDDANFIPAPAPRVERYESDGSLTLLDSSVWTARKLYEDRDGVADTLIYLHGAWPSGDYLVTALWGEGSVPSFVQTGIAKLARWYDYRMEQAGGLGDSYYLMEGDGEMGVAPVKLPPEVLMLQDQDRTHGVYF